MYPFQIVSDKVTKDKRNSILPYNIEQKWSHLFKAIFLGYGYDVFGKVNLKRLNKHVVCLFVCIKIVFEIIFAIYHIQICNQFNLFFQIRPREIIR